MWDNIIQYLAGTDDIPSEVRKNILELKENYDQKEYEFSDSTLDILSKLATTTYEIPVKKLHKNISKYSFSCFRTNDIVHFQGFVEFNPQKSNNYEDIASIPPEHAPCAYVIVEQSKRGVWGDARFRVNADGTIRLKHRSNTHLNANWIASKHIDAGIIPSIPTLEKKWHVVINHLAKNDGIDVKIRKCFLDVQKAHVQSAISIPKPILDIVSRYAKGTYEIPVQKTHKDISNCAFHCFRTEDIVHFQGFVEFKNGKDNNYEEIARISHEHAPNLSIVVQQSKRGVWGDSRISVDKHGIITLKHRRNTHLKFSWIAKR